MEGVQNSCVTVKVVFKSVSKFSSNFEKTSRTVTHLFSLSTGLEFQFFSSNFSSQNHSKCKSKKVFLKSKVKLMFRLLILRDSQYVKLLFEEQHKKCFKNQKQ